MPKALPAQAIPRPTTWTRSVAAALVALGLLAPSSLAGTGDVQQLHPGAGVLTSTYGKRVAVDGDRVAILGATSEGPDLSVFEAGTGLRVWSDFIQDQTSSLDLADGLVALGMATTDGGTVLLYDDGSEPLPASPTAPIGAEFFGLDVALGDGVLAVGAPGDDNAGQDHGAVYLVASPFDGAPLPLHAEGDTRRLGEALAMDGGRVLAGAPADDGGEAGAGAVFLFDVATGQQLLRLQADAPGLGANLGKAVALDGDLALVGAPNETEGGFPSGAAYVFDLTTGQQLVRLVPDRTGAAVQFGKTVALEGTEAYVGQQATIFTPARVKVFDALTGALLRELAPPGGFDGGLADLDVDTGRLLLGLPPFLTPTVETAKLLDATTGDQLQQFLPTDGNGLDRFGAHVALADGLAVIAAPDRNFTVGGVFGVSKQGTVYVLDTADGTEVSRIVPPDTWHNQADFAESVVLQGSTVVVGSPRYRPRGCCTVTGGALVYDALTGALVTQLVPEELVDDDHFGSSLALSGGRALIGTTRARRVYVYDTATWEVVDTLQPPGTAWVRDVAIDGDLVVVGTTPPDEFISTSGGAWTWDVATGAPLASLQGDDVSPMDSFGISVDLEGTLVAVGAPGTVGPGGDGGRGAVYLYDAVSGTRLHKVQAPDFVPGDGGLFGSTVDLDEGVLLVGAPGDGEGGGDTGAVYLFDAATATPLGKYVFSAPGPGAALGIAAAIDGGQVLAGTPLADVLADDAGAAYLWDVSGPWFPFGFSLPGVAGRPCLRVDGPLTPSSPVDVSLVGAAGNATASWVLGLSEVLAPFKQGVLVPSPDVVFSLPTDAQGELAFALTFPTGVPSGTDLWIQTWIADAAGPAGFAASNAVRATVP